MLAYLAIGNISAAASREARHRSCAVARVFLFVRLRASPALRPSACVFPGGTRATQSCGPGHARARVAALQAIPNRNGTGTMTGTPAGHIELGVTSDLLDLVINVSPSQIRSERPEFT